MTAQISETTAFEALMEQVVPIEGGACTATVTEDWMQGRAVFGGLMGAIGVQALRRTLPAETASRPLRGLMTSFIGPPGAGKLRIQCEELRSGRTATWAEARIHADDQLCTTVTACLGDRRESKISVPPAGRPECRAPEDSRAMPFLPGLTPNFFQHFHLHWAIGKMPMSASDGAEMGVWLRYRQITALSEAHVVALMDALPPAVMQMYREMKPISTLTWHLEMLDDLEGEDTRDAEGWWFFHVRADHAADGYSAQNATLYTPAGRAIAMSQQVIAVFG